MNMSGSRPDWPKQRGIPAIRHKPASRRRWLAACCLLVAFVVSFTADAAPPQSIAAILDAQRSHGYSSATAALKQLQDAAGMLAKGAPTELRRRYYRAMVEFSILAKQPEQTKQALAQLKAMAIDEQCRPCRIQWLIGDARLKLSQQALTAALDDLAKARALLVDGDKALRQQVAGVEAVVRGKSGDMAKAIELGVKASTLAHEIGHVADQISTMALLVVLNTDMGDLKRADALAKEAYAMADAIDFRPVMATLRLNQGHLYALTNNRSAQLAALNDALRIAQNVPDLVDIEILSLSNLADYHLALPGHEQQALELASRGADLARRARMPVYLAMALSNMGIASVRLGRVDDGIALLEEGITIFKVHGNKRYAAAVTMELIAALESDGQYQEALAHMHTVAALNDEFTRQERNSAVLELQEKYSAERNANEIRRLSAENARKQADVAARTREQRLWAALAVLLAITAALLVYFLKRVRRTNRQLAFDNAALTEETVIDPLTGVFNRRYFQTLMQRQKIQFERRKGDHPEPKFVALMVLDVDRFKQINDKYGHVTGDAVLIAIANRLRDLTRQCDAVVRWGGEEFVMMLPGTDANGLVAMAGRILETIGGKPFILDDDTAITVTVSAGGVVYDPASDQHWEDLLHIADQAMYLSKSSGRNRMTCVTGIRPDARMNRIRSDLNAARSSGEIELQTVLWQVTTRA